MDIQQVYQQIKNSGGVSTDTRTIRPGMVFFAFKGDNFDANAFVQQALDEGASLVITQNENFREHPDCFYTTDSLRTLQDLAALHRKTLKSIIIGITGTNGKTTTKELIREALSSVGSVQATQGNLNNHIGVPLTLLSINDETDFAIVEMGANHPGEIDLLCNIARPDYGVITNIGRAHLEGFGSFEGVIKTKTELYRFIAANGRKVFVNENDEMLMQLSKEQPRILYGMESLNAEVVSDENPQLRCIWNWHGTTYYTATNLTGNYNLPNVLAAIGIALHFGGKPEDISLKLSEYKPSNMRSQWVDTGRNQLILDAYNANPSSMAVALKNFAALKTDNKLPILGDMLELGSYSNEEHRKVLEILKDLNFTTAVLIGPSFSKFSSEFPSYQFFPDTAEAKTALTKSDISGCAVLLKGSRGIGVDSLKDIF